MENAQLEPTPETTPAEEAATAISAWPFMGYAPGNYSCKCVDCDETFQGEKRCLHCLECAVVAAKSALIVQPAITPAAAEPELKQFGVIFQSGETRHFNASRMSRDDDWIVLWNGDEQIAHFCRPAGAGAQ